MAIPARDLYAAIIVMAAIVVAGCTPVPLARNYQISTQYRLRAAQHWQMLAEQASQQIRNHGDSGPHPVLYVIGTGAVRSPFSQAFESYLSDKLVQSCDQCCSVTQGHTWSAGDGREPNDFAHPIFIQYGVQRIQHRASLKRPPFGLFTLLGTGVWLGHQAADHWSAATDFPAAIGEGAAIDLLSGVIAAPTHTEVIISYVALDNDGKILWRSSDSYYVSDSDADEYPDLPLYAGVGSRGPVNLVNAHPVHLSN
jgi:hypothetical protein